MPPTKLKMYENERLVTIGILTVTLFTSGLLSLKKCEYRYESTDHVRNGSFKSPNWPQRYSDRTRCLYKFIARKNEKVKLQFNSFKIQGIRSRDCHNDYLDIYIDLEVEDDDLLDRTVMGRFCGEMLGSFTTPFISSYSVIAMNFFSDNLKTDSGFHGSFAFISNAPYHIGIMASGSTCDYKIDARDRPHGYIVSPTYPGVYPDNLYCVYRLDGRIGQRIKLTFDDFELFDGGSHCPYDSVSVYDGPSKSSQFIDVFCGHYRGLTLFSTSRWMYIEFVTRRGRVDYNRNSMSNEGDFSFPRRGFNISYEFREDFVNMYSKDVPPNAQHIIGSECDLRIQSSKHSNGTIRSPNYPLSFPVNVTCSYILDGMLDIRNREKVQVKFVDFQIPGSTPRCVHGYVSVRKKNGARDVAEDEKFCGGDVLPPQFVSKSSRLVITFNSTNGIPGRGFAAEYQFRINYDIPGKQLHPDMCTFNYRSDKSKTGSFNSPWHPQNYPPNTDCVYILNPEPTEYIHLSFDLFNLPDKAKDKNNSCKDNDYVEIYEYTSSSSRFRIGQYCGATNPGPIVSSPGISEMRVLFRSNAIESSMGFIAFYEFLPISSLSKECIQSVQSNGSGGVIFTPNYYKKYDRNTFCRWMLRASKPNNTILLQFPKFALEGDNLDCARAVMRINYKNDPSHMQQMCGIIQGLSFESSSDTINVSFISSHTSVGGDGFKMTWTEIHKTKGQCTGFECQTTKYCIDSSLRCNDISNCGKGDNSDEVYKCPTKETNDILHIIISASISIGFLFIFILIACLCYRHRKQCRESAERKNPQNDCVEVRYVSPTSAITRVIDY